MAPRWPDAEFALIAWRPGAWTTRIAALLVFDAVVGVAVFACLVEWLLDAGLAAMFGVMGLVVLTLGGASGIVVTTGRTRVRGQVAKGHLVLVAIDHSALRPDLNVRIPLRGLGAHWHLDEMANNLVLRPSGDAWISLASEDGSALERLVVRLREEGVRID